MTAKDHYGQGKEFYEAKDYEAALMCAEKAIALDGDKTIYWHEKANALWRLEQYEESLVACESALVLDKNYAPSWYRKGTICDDLKDYAQALVCYDKAIELDDKYANPWHEKGNMYRNIKDYDNAFACYGKAIELDDKYANPWGGKGNIFFDLKDYDNALVCYEKAIELDNKHPYPWDGKGNIYHALKDYDNALACYGKAIELDDKFVNSWNNKGNVFFDLKGYDNALVCYDKAIELDDKIAAPWSGKGNIYHALKDYDNAFACYGKAIELDDKLANPWNGKGLLYRILKDYDNALVSYVQAIELDDTYAAPWNGKGNVYRALKDYDNALVCYNQAIELDDKYAYPWNGKGNIYHELNDYVNAKMCYTRSNFLGNDLLNNSLLLFSKYSQVPLYCYELLQGFIHSKNYQNWRDLINLTIEQCQSILIYINYLQLIQKDKQLELWQWHQWLGIVYYYMGHPIKSYEYLKKVVTNKKEDLMSYYYLILSCRDFAQPEEEYLEMSLDIAQQIKPRKRRFDFFGKKPVLSEYELQQIYYAGQLWYLAQEHSVAFSYFERIKNDYLPAAYMCLELKGGASNKLGKEIIRAERKVLNTSESFLSGIPAQNLDLELEDFRVPFFKYARYYEIKTGIGLLEYEIGDSDFKDFEPTFPDTLKAFWYTWKLSPQQYQQIFEIAKKEGVRRRADDILTDREHVLGFTAAEVDNLEERSTEVIDRAESAKLRNAYNNLKMVSPSNELEKQMGDELNDWTLTKAAHYRNLTSLFFLENKLSETQKIYLDFFSVLREYDQRKPSDLLIAGEKGVVKALVGIAYDKMLDDEKPMGQLLEVILKSFAKSSIAELVAKWRKQPNPKYKTYSEFKNNFREFIGEEQKRLGADFEKQYPLFGFEEWLE